MTFTYSVAGLAIVAAFCATPVLAQEVAGPITVGGSVAVLTDYRLRGVSQSDDRPAVQGALTVAHESGFYVGTFASNLAGWGTFGGSNLELDAIGGFKHGVGGATVDAGLTWYMYPGGADKTDYAEAFAKLSGTAGPATLLAGVAYAPQQQALGTWYRNGAEAAAGIYSDPGDKGDNLYLWGDGAVAIPGTGLTAKAHLGWSKGNRGLGPNATSAAPTGEYWDWQLGADYAVPHTPLTVNVSWIDTDIARRDAAYLQPSFSKGQDGRGSIAGSTLFASLTAAF
jgi:uncharacterized protein (TIGR02001 family)